MTDVEPPHSIGLVIMRLQDIIEECDERIDEIKLELTEQRNALEWEANKRLFEVVAERQQAERMLAAARGDGVGNVDPGQTLDEHVHDEFCAHTAETHTRSDATCDFSGNIIPSNDTPGPGGGPVVPVTDTPLKKGALGDDHYRAVADVYRNAELEGRKTHTAVRTTFRVSVSTANNWISRARKLGFLAPPASKRVPKPEAPQVTASVSAPSSGFAPSNEATKQQVPRPGSLGLAPSPQLTPGARFVARGGHREPPTKQERHAAERIPDLSLVAPADDPAAEMVRVGATHEQVAAIALAAYRESRRPIAAIRNRFDVDQRTANVWVRECRERGLMPPRDQPPVPGELPGKAIPGASRGRSGVE